MKTSQVKSYYERYMHAVSKHGYRSIYDCYKNPSGAKVSAERAIANEIYSKGGYGYSVITYNTNNLLAVICLAEMANCGLQFIRRTITER